MTPAELRERVAEALMSAEDEDYEWSRLPEDSRDAYLDSADAAIAEIVEACARVCDAYAKGRKHTSTTAVAMELARRIRALAPKPGGAR